MALSSREICAAITCEAWRLCRGSYPSASNASLWEAADLLWLASGCPPLPSRTSKTSWERPFKRALATTNGFEAYSVRYWLKAA
jgi:hypothetical protein